MAERMPSLSESVGRLAGKGGVELWISGEEDDAAIHGIDRIVSPLKASRVMEDACRPFRYRAEKCRVGGDVDDFGERGCLQSCFRCFGMKTKIDGFDAEFSGKGGDAAGFTLRPWEW